MEDAAVSSKYVTPVSTSVAVVTVTLEIVCGSNWGGDCPMDQVFKQAVNEAEGRLRRLQDESKGEVRAGKVQDVRIVTTARKP